MRFLGSRHSQIACFTVTCPSTLEVQPALPSFRLINGAIPRKHISRMHHWVRESREGRWELRVKNTTIVWKTREINSGHGTNAVPRSSFLLLLYGCCSLLESRSGEVRYLFVSHSIKSRFLRNDSSMHFPMHRICGTPPRTAVPFRFVDVPPLCSSLQRLGGTRSKRESTVFQAECNRWRGDGPSSFVISYVQWQPVGFVDRVCNLLSCFARSPAVVSMSLFLSPSPIFTPRDPRRCALCRAVIITRASGFDSAV